MSADYHPTVQLIKNLLDEHQVAYKAYEHEAVRTSEEAQRVRPEYKLSQGAKALIVRIKKRNVRKSGRLAQEVASDFDGGKNRDNLNSSCKEAKEQEREFVQIVVPGDAKFDTAKVRQLLDAKDIRFATPEEVAELTNGIVPGGVPPFGNLFGIRVVADKGITKETEIVFNAGDRRYSIALATEDYLAVVNPLVAEVV